MYDVDLPASRSHDEDFSEDLGTISLHDLTLQGRM
jgi:hypothetical protein